MRYLRLLCPRTVNVKNCRLVTAVGLGWQVFFIVLRFTHPSVLRCEIVANICVPPEAVKGNTALCWCVTRWQLALCGSWWWGFGSWFSCCVI